MLKILNTQQVRDLDAYTITHEPVTSIALMERACYAFTEWFRQRFTATEKIGVVCGTGNNGGDGLGIARILKSMRWDVKVAIVKGGKESDDFSENLRRWREENEVHEITSAADIDFAGYTILIDAIFGSGLSRTAVGIYADVIAAMNNCDATRLAVDVPSGLLADRHSSGQIIRAHHTVSFQFPKLAFLLPENEKYVGEWHLADIGLSTAFIQEAETPYYYLTRESVRNIVKPLSRFAHKGDNGRALLIAGSYGKMGACILATWAALRSGVGLVTSHIPQVGYAIIQSTAPEAMASIDDHPHYFSSCPELEVYKVIGVGPGLGVEKATVKAFKRVLESGKPMVIDADALNMLSTHSELVPLVPAGSILTPHPKEFERWVGKWKDDFDRLARQVQLSKQLRSVVILKGANTSISTPEGKVYFNSTGNPGMAKGGSGDVLTGLLTGLLAQKYTVTETAILGVYLHGLAADCAIKKTGMRSLTASDLVDFLSVAYQELGS